MNGFNPQALDIDRQIQEERNKMAELERRKMQLMYGQPTILNQTIQTGSQASGIRYAESIDEVKREMIFMDTLFVNRAFTNMWYKTPTGAIKTYMLDEFIPKDEKDIKIEKLESEIRELKEQRKYEPSRTDNNSTVEGTISSTVPTTRADEEK